MGGEEGRREERKKKKKQKKCFIISKNIRLTDAIKDKILDADTRKQKPTTLELFGWKEEERKKKKKKNIP